MKTELLAPAKDKETAFAAIDCGADAVYIGASGYGARRNAANSLEDIKAVVEYAHKFWAKVFVTVNTILRDDELEDAVELVKDLDKTGVDAVLVQDMGLVSKLKDLKLSVPIHASTQCDNRDSEKIRFFRNIGFSRVVLARELSLEQIKTIHEQNPDIELEAFIHGALCVSYSGQCYLSQFIGGRSANRGECAQPCRKKYSVLNDKGEYIAKDIYALCLKDFNASKSVKEMIEAGIYSFKIEGRLKDVGYVKNVVAYYRQLLDKYSEKSSSGISIYPFAPDVEKSFNRGFTDYFLNGRCDCFNFVSQKSRGKYIGKSSSSQKNDKSVFIETKAEISAQDGLCFVSDGELQGFLVNKAEKVGGGFLVYPNRQIKINKNTKIYRNVDVEFEKELLKPVKRQIGVRVELSGNVIKLTDEDGVSVSEKIISTEKAKNKEKMKETFVKQFSKTGESDFYITEISIDSELPFMPVSEINQIRRDAFSKLMQKRLSDYKRELQKPLKEAEFYKKELDYRANISNKTAEEFYKSSGSEPEEYCPEVKLPSRQIELMRTKHCIKYALKMCKSPQKLFLQDEKGVKYPLLFDCSKCEMAVLSP